MMQYLYSIMYNIQNVPIH